MTWSQGLYFQRCCSSTLFKCWKQYEPTRIPQVLPEMWQSGETNIFKCLWNEPVHLGRTVDGRNPEPVSKWFMPLLSHYLQCFIITYIIVANWCRIYSICSIEAHSIIILIHHEPSVGLSCDHPALAWWSQQLLLWFADRIKYASYRHRQARLQFSQRCSFIPIFPKFGVEVNTVYFSRERLSAGFFQ